LLRDSRDIIQRLRRDGFELISTRGSHHKFVHPQLRRIVIVPHPKRDLPIGTVSSTASGLGH
jgi:predicted RNA binding protein YcfA (HicA-like mRNA interferase family)